jgi:hypothetical protein
VSAKPAARFAEAAISADSGLDPAKVEDVWFSDSYVVKLDQPSLGVIDLFEAVLGHHPRWAIWLLAVRNRLAELAGLEVPPEATFRRFVRKPDYAVGDLIGPWPIFALNEAELIAGRDNRHLDFRFSVLKLNGPPSAAAFSTICNVHNRFGKFYLLLVVPFHRWGMRALIRRAIAAGRL